MTSINEMPAGPQLDRLIADKVMGWEIDEDNGSWVCFTNDRVIYIYEDFLVDGPEEPFNPSTNIAHAWEVVGKIPQFIVWHSEGAWHAAQLGTDRVQYFSDRYIDDSLTNYAKADTAPLAICRAALLAFDWKP